jgi:hypothetical protein
MGADVFTGVLASFEELDHACPIPLAYGAQREPERSGGLSLAVAGVDVDQA